MCPNERELALRRHQAYENYYRQRLQRLRDLMRPVYERAFLEWLTTYHPELAAKTTASDVRFEWPDEVQN